MHLLKLRISKDCTITHDALSDAAYGLYGPEENIPTDMMGVLRSRSAAKDITYALQAVVRAYQRFPMGEDTCKLLCTPARGATGLDLRLHVQRRGPGKVEYTQELGRIHGAGDDIALQRESVSWEYQAVMDAIGTVAHLRTTGATYRYEPEIRRIVYALLATRAIALWPGIWVVMQADDVQGITAQVSRLLAHTTTGSATLTSLVLEDAEANKAHVLEEIAQGILERFEALQGRLDLPAPQVKRLRLDYDALGDDIVRIETLVGANLPDEVLEKQLDFGLALSQAEREAVAVAG